MTIVEDGRGQPPLSPNDVLAPHSFVTSLLKIGYLTHPVDIEGWIDAVSRRYQFLNDLTPDEMRWATCNPGHQRELVAAIEALAPKVQDREASLEVAG